MIPYGKQTIEEADLEAVAGVLRSDWLTTGPKVAEFERAVAEFCGIEHAVAVSNGTAALHAAMAALGIGPGDEVVVPAITFVATANAVVYQGGTPVFADIDPETLLVDPGSVESKISDRTKAIVVVDYAGQPCDYDELREIARRHNLPLVSDACHALGATYKGYPAGSLADISIFSFHPVKPLTTAEGGMVVTNNPQLAKKVRIFRNHGITTDFRQREASGSWCYEMVALGFNYRLPDLSCALGLSQLTRLPSWIRRRNEIAAAYDRVFMETDGVRPLVSKPDRTHGYHLYVVTLQGGRNAAYTQLRDAGIGVNVHYMPVYLHPFYRDRGYPVGLCPSAERVFSSILSLPVYPLMTDEQVGEVIGKVCATADRSGQVCFQ